MGSRGRRRLTYGLARVGSKRPCPCEPLRRCHIRYVRNHVHVPFVFPDTNAIRGRVLAPREAGSWRALIDECPGRGWTLVLSELVEWELAALLRRHLEKHAVRANDAARALGAFADVAGPSVDIGMLVAREMDRLRSDVLAVRGDLREIPDVPLASLAQRAIERRPPFDEKGSGFRDSLIWETAIQLASGGEIVVLVSGDRRGFGTAQGLDARLAEEARRRCASPACVELVGSLSEALDRVRTGVARPMPAGPRDEDVVIAMIEVIRQLKGFPLYAGDLPRFGLPRGFDGVRVSDAEWLSGPRFELVGDGSPSTYQGVMAISASLDARGYSDTLYDSEIAGLISEGSLRDFGRGLVDGLDRFHVEREVEVLFEMRLDPGPVCRVLEVRLPEPPVPRVQLELEIS